ncbi:MAG: hypothetical protein ACO1N1_00105 [Dyadobacter fermentans]
MKDIEKARRYLRNAGEMLRKNEVDEDGNLIAAISRAGLDIAEKIINWAEQKTAA